MTESGENLQPEPTYGGNFKRSSAVVETLGGKPSSSPGSTSCFKEKSIQNCELLEVASIYSQLF